MHVIGTATHNQVTVAARNRKFKINELLIIQDRELGDLIGEVILTQTLNPLVPDVNAGAGIVLDEKVMAAMKELGYDPAQEAIYLAQVRLLEELTQPVDVGSTVRIPTFDEVKDVLMPCPVENGLVLGVIRGTEDLISNVPESIRNVAPLYDKRKGLLKQSGVPFVFEYSAMDQYPHIGIFGGSGSGKSFALRVILESLMAKSVPCLVLDPHYELSFSEIMPGLNNPEVLKIKGRSEILTLGQDVGIRFEDLSPSDLITVLSGAFASFSENMDYTARSLYQTRDSLLSYKTRLQDLKQLMENPSLRKAVELDDSEALERDFKIPGANLSRLKKVWHDYGNRGFNLETIAAVLRRLGMLEAQGVFRGSIENLLSALLARKVVVVRGPTDLLNVFAAYVLNLLFRRRRDYKDASHEVSTYVPPFVVATDEAHNLAPKNAEAAAKNILRQIAQEGRKYGIFLVLATQRPALLDDTVNSQLNTKLVFRTVRAQDIDVIERETDISKQELARLPYLATGNAFLSSAILGRTVAIRIRSSWTVSPHAESPFEELNRTASMDEERLWPVVKQNLPLDDISMLQVLDKCQRSLGRTVSIDELKSYLEKWAEEGKVQRRELKGIGGVRYF